MRNRILVSLAAFVAALVLGAGLARAQSPAQPAAREGASAVGAGAADVQAAAAAFVEAFNNLDWEKFRLGFTDDATVFFPFPQVPRRASGRAEVEAVFKRFFDEARKRKAAPPYLNIEPKDMQIQVLGDAAIVTFHLGDDDNNVGRRTLVYQKQKGRWLIAHLHASSLTRPKPAQGQ